MNFSATTSGTPESLLISAANRWPFTGEPPPKLPKNTTPAETLALLDGQPPVLDTLFKSMQRVIITTGLELIEEPRMRSRTRRIKPADRLDLYVRRVLTEALKSGLYDLWYPTINLAEGEDHNDVIDSFFRDLDINPPWTGVRVPKNSIAPCQDHVHLIVAVPFDRDVMTRFADFALNRNKRQDGRIHISVLTRWVYYVPGLISYFKKPHNLGVPGAKVIASDGIKG